MRLLLDSHVVLWWLESSRRLGRGARRAITDADQVMVSAVTPWELGVKRAMGRLEMPDDLVDATARAGFESLAITATHAALAPTLADHHRDPFDRMLIAQARLEQLVLVSADDSLTRYGVEVLDARR